ncbi:MAG: hypothetical protein CM1200mP14_13520 [Gammaproteobacteria bacterium]|nr:MAG: hypothetical protein CM1200mP14_13520 [Gammaproteobacteria bacterium]
MEREYPPLLRDAGIGGTVQVFFFIDEEGTVQQFQINESSGHQALGDAALAVAGVYRFSAALKPGVRGFLCGFLSGLHSKSADTEPPRIQRDPAGAPAGSLSFT